MSSIIVCGGGIVGLSAAMMLAADGHVVTVLEADPDPVPASPAQAWQSWRRKGGAQFRQRSRILPELRIILRLALVDGLDRLNRRHLLRIHAGAVQLGHRHRQNNQNNGDHDQQLDERKAEFPAVLFHTNLSH